MLSLKVAAACVLLVCVPAIALGHLLARKQFRAKAFVDALVHLPLVLPPVVIGYMLLVSFGRQGWLGGWLENQWGLSIVFSWQACALASAVMAFPLMVRAVRLSIEQIDPKLEAAARSLGASPLDVWRSVTLPLAAPGILSGMTLAFARSLGEFGATITFAGNIAGETRTLPLALFSAIQVPGGEGMAARLVVISIVLSLASLLVSEWLARRIRARLNPEVS